MNRTMSIWGWASRDRAAWWGGGAALAVLFFAVAWADVRLLLGLPLVAVALAVLYLRRHGQEPVAEQEFEDW